MSYISRALLRKKPRPRIVAAGGRIPENQVSPAAKLQCVSRIPIPIGADCRSIRLVFDNWSLGSLGVVADNPTTMTIVKVAVEIDGTTVPVRFQGSRSYTMAAGQVRLVSDRIYPVQFSLQRFEADTLAWFRGSALLPSGTGRHLTGCIATFSDTEGDAFFAYYDPANDVDQVDSTGDMSTPTGATVASSASTYDVAQGWGPSAVIGEMLNRNAVSLIVVGDSMTTGREDDYASPVLAGLGFIDRAAHPSDGALTNVIPVMHASKSGGKVSSLKDNSNIPAYFRYATHLVQNGGTNDIGSGGGLDDAPTVHANRAVINAAARARGVRKVMGTIMTPRNQTTDDFAANATANAVWSASGTGDLLNGLVNDDFDDGTIDLALPFPGIRQTANKFLWFLNGTPTYMVNADGLHPSTVAHGIMGADLRYGIQTALDLPLVARRFSINCATKPSGDQPAALRTLSEALADAGALAGCELLYLLGAQDEQAGLLNFIAPGSFQLTKDSAPTFSTFSGWVGDGTDDGLSTGVAPSAFTVASLNSMCVVVGILTNSDQASPVCGTTTATGAQRTMFLNPHNGGVFQARVNDVTTSTASTPLVTGSARSDGIWYANRSGASARQFGKDGVEFATDTAASTALSASAVRLLRGALTTDFSTRKLWMFGIFSDMSGKHLAIYNALNAYKTTMGIA